MQTTEEGNKMIQEFMGTKVKPDGHFITNYIYHSSWDALMPVVEKISKTIINGYPPSNTDQYVRVEIVPTGYVKISNLRYTPIFTNVSVEGSLIKAVWKAVVVFIQWHNSNTSPVNKEQ